MLTFRFVDPDTKDILLTIDVIPKDDIDSLLFQGSVSLHGNIQTVDEEKGIKGNSGRFCHAYTSSRIRSVIWAICSWEMEKP